MRGLTGGTGVPADLAVSVGVAESGWEYGRCAAVVSVAVSGPVRVQYAMTDPAGPLWLRHAEVRERRRRRVLVAVLRSGALESRAPGGVVESAPHGWLYVSSGDRRAWVRLPVDGRVSGVAVRDLVLGLVPGPVWGELHALRDRAWQTWARQPRGDVRVLSPEETIRDEHGTEETIRDERGPEETIQDPAPWPGTALGGLGPEDRIYIPRPGGGPGGGPGVGPGGGGVW